MLLVTPYFDDLQHLFQVPLGIGLESFHCIYVLTYVCMWTCICMWTHIRTYVDSHMYVFELTYVCTYVDSHTYVCGLTYVCTLHAGGVWSVSGCTRYPLNLPMYVSWTCTCGTLRKWLLRTYVHTYIHGVLSILQSCTYIRMCIGTKECSDG